METIKANYSIQPLSLNNNNNSKGRGSSIYGFWVSDSGGFSISSGGGSDGGDKALETERKKARLSWEEVVSDKVMI